MHSPAYSLLEAHLWDLRAHAEAKLRCLTRLQPQLSALQSTSKPEERAVVRRQVMDDLRDIVSISQTLQTVANDALKAAADIPP
jgi:hypothetical protein